MVQLELGNPGREQIIRLFPPSIKSVSSALEIGRPLYQTCEGIRVSVDFSLSKYSISWIEVKEKTMYKIGDLLVSLLF